GANEEEQSSATEPNPELDEVTDIAENEIENIADPEEETDQEEDSSDNQKDNKKANYDDFNIESFLNS
ncbi:MAG: hypothetical protein ACO2XZ_05405, partial [Rickettsiales bacterium]